MAPRIVYFTKRTIFFMSPENAELICHLSSFGFASQTEQFFAIMISSISIALQFIWASK